MKKLIVSIILLFSFAIPAFAGPYIGVGANFDHGNTQIIGGFNNLIGPFGLEVAHTSEYLLPDTSTVCGSTIIPHVLDCSTNIVGGVKNTLAATVNVPLVFGLSGIAKAGVVDKNDGYLAGVGVGIEPIPHIHVRFEDVRYQVHGNARNVPMLSGLFEF